MPTLGFARPRSGVTNSQSALDNFTASAITLLQDMFISYGEYFMFHTFFGAREKVYPRPRNISHPCCVYIMYNRDWNKIKYPNDSGNPDYPDLWISLLCD